MRPTLEQCMMLTATIFASRSCCSRLKVGCVVTNESLSNIISIGYNGAAKGLPNQCESDEPGKCGCNHAELNGILKSDYSIPNKKIFITHSPCRNCAKYIINASIKEVYFNELYRDSSGIDLLTKSSILVYHINDEGDMKLWI